MKNTKISVISFMAMVCVVWWHCYCGSSVERWFIPGFCVWSVPWFFFLSGVLFRRTLESKTFAAVVESKVRSLFIPYILWCAVGASVTIVANIGSGGGGIGCVWLLVHENTPLGQQGALVRPFVANFHVVSCSFPVCS